MGGVPVPNGCADVALVPSKMLMIPAWAAASAAACAICRWAYICPPSIANPSAPISRMLMATTTRMTACPSSAAESRAQDVSKYDDPLCGAAEPQRLRKVCGQWIVRIDGTDSYVLPGSIGTARIGYSERPEGWWLTGRRSRSSSPPSQPGRGCCPARWRYRLSPRRNACCRAQSRNARPRAPRWQPSYTPAACGLSRPRTEA